VALPTFGPTESGCLTMASLLFLCGSLRKDSSSAALTRALASRVSGDATASTVDIGSLPHYNSDIQGDAAVEALKRAIAGANGVVIISSEYNYSIPDVLKNALDWASRPANASVFRDKPVLVITVSGGVLGACARRRT
jgi:chromate reductase